MNEKKYRLLKDCLDSKQGDTFSYDKENDCYYNDNRDGSHIDYLSPKILENNPDWFEEVLPVSEPVPERITVELDGNDTDEPYQVLGKGYYEFRTSKEIPEDKFPAIKQAIESVINNDFRVHIDGTWSIHSEWQKTFTQSEVDAIRCDTWDAARMRDDGTWSNQLFPDGKNSQFKYPLIKDWLNSLSLNSKEPPLYGYNCEGKPIEHFKSNNNSNDTGKEEKTDYDLAIEKITQLEKSGLHWMHKYYALLNKPEQPNNDNTFVWTDSAVVDILNTHRSSTEILAKYVYDLETVKKWKEVYQQSKLSTPVDTLGEVNTGSLNSTISPTRKINIESPMPEPLPTKQDKEIKIGEEVVDWAERYWFIDKILKGEIGLDDKNHDKMDYPSFREKLIKNINHSVSEFITPTNSSVTQAPPPASNNTDKPAGCVCEVGHPYNNLSCPVHYPQAMAYQETKPVLFTTEDGVGVKEFDEC